MLHRSRPATAQALGDALREARARTLELVADLTDAQLMGLRLPIVNPLRWEIAHVAWFQERWLLRHLRRRPPLLEHGDSLYDSARVAHDTRWDIPLLSRADTLTYMQRVLDAALAPEVHPAPAGLKDEFGRDEVYYLFLTLYHEDMHAEAIAYTRQTLGYPSPRVGPGGPWLPTLKKTDLVRVPGAGALDAGPHPAFQCVADLPSSPPASGDAFIPGGKLYLGSPPELSFAFDNELGSHMVTVAPFSIARTAVSNAEFAEFTADGGYDRPELWSEAGWRWRTSVEATQPVYWHRGADGWLRRHFDAWVPLEPTLPVLHINAYEAEAWCRWAGRRLPTEAEWEMAASSEPSADGRSLTGRQRLFPWGDAPPDRAQANLDWRAGGCVPIDALPEGDSAFGCRQMIGNVWEWTATVFAPYPGFTAGPYQEYSAPWFDGQHRVLRGGCWATRSRLICNTYRNFYPPDRRDVWAGFRTCAR